MDLLPFADGQFDVAIFNASFHYSTNYRNTLREVIRCLTANGKILIIDSPTYRHSESGRQMQVERRALFEKMYGFASDRLPSQDFLTAEMMESWTDLGISWETYRPWYGMKWALRPWFAKLKKRREPSKFHIYLGHLGKA
jgi:ubiquinone/menaquinone biosynthesis C-methylase UbiE